MTIFDFTIIFILVVSSLFGFFRGFLKEIISFFSYILAIVSTIWAGPKIYILIELYVEMVLLRVCIAYIMVFLAVLILIESINELLLVLIRVTKISKIDHILGGFFGFIRGVLLTLALVAFCEFTPLKGENWWINAKFLQPSIQILEVIKPFLSKSLKKFGTISQINFVDY